MSPTLLASRGSTVICHDAPSSPIRHLRRFSLPPQTPQGSQLPAKSPQKPETRSLSYHLKTLFIFAQDDLKNIVLPETIFAVATVIWQARYNATSALTTLATSIVLRLPLVILWFWLLVLINSIANQRQPDSVAEDAINKPWRPIPTSRLTSSEALSMLRGVVLATLVLSAGLGCFESAAATMAVIWLYNDLGGSDAGPLLRNGLNGAGTICTGLGGPFILSGGQYQAPLAWVLMTAAAVATTIHVQDLPDVEGDRSRGRKTMPLVCGDGWTRWSVAGLIGFWSVVCPVYLRVSAWVAWGAVFGVGAVIGFLITQRRGHDADKRAWKLWCLWITVIFVLPVFA